MTLNHAWMLKGWLLAEHAPAPIMEAVEEVIGSLSGPVVSCVSVFQPIVELADEMPKDPCPAPQPEPNPPEKIEPAKPPKKTRNWSPETREAARERMKTLRASQLAKTAEQPGNSRAPSHRGA